MQDRIRAIANALGLQTIIWSYDSNDWRVGINNITAADVDTDYQLFINNETAGNFNSAGAIMLTHELNNFTMSEAVKWYPALKSAFSVRHITLSHNLTLLTSVLVHGPHRRRAQQDEPVQRDQLFPADVPAVYVVVPPEFIAI